MEGIEKKVLKIIKKNASSDLTVGDISVIARCDDDDVTMALDSLLAQDLVSKDVKPDGKPCWYPAEPAPKAKRGGQDEMDDVEDKGKDAFAETEIIDKPAGIEESRATTMAAKAAALADEDEPFDTSDGPDLDDDDEPVVRQNPITGFFMNLLNRPPKDEDDDLPEELPDDEPVKDPEAKTVLGKTEKKILSLLKKNVEDDLDSEDIALRLKKEDDEIAASLEVLLSEGLVTKKTTPKNTTVWAAA